MTPLAADSDEYLTDFHRQPDLAALSTLEASARKPPAILQEVYRRNDRQLPRLVSGWVYHHATMFVARTFARTQKHNWLDARGNTRCKRATNRSAAPDAGD